MYSRSSSFRRCPAFVETKRRILDAAHNCLRKAPTEAHAVAQAASVARSTIYLVFGSRAGLFEALVADLTMRREYERLIEAVAHPDARHHLRKGMRAGLEMFIADRDLFRVLISMSRLDPDAVGGAVDRWEAKRAGGIEYLGRRLAEQGYLRPDITADEAAHVCGSSPASTASTPSTPSEDCLPTKSSTCWPERRNALCRDGRADGQLREDWSGLEMRRPSSRTDAILRRSPSAHR